MDHKNGLKSHNIWMAELENNAEKGSYIYIFRWHNHLNPMIKKTPWDEDEEWILFLYHKALSTILMKLR